MKNLNKVHLNGLKAVEAIGRLGSLPKAAEELGVSVSAVSQQLIRTEGQIGHAIFERTRGGLVATPFGKGFLARLEEGFRSLSKAVAMADGADQTLMLSVAPTFASKWLVPRLGRLRSSHPDLKIRIDPSPGIVDLKSSDIDLAIRLGKGDWRDGAPERLLPQRMFPVCTRNVALRLKGPADIFNQPIICYDNPMFSWDDWQTAAGLEGPLPFDGTTFSDPWLGLEAAISGQGIMLAWDLFVEDALADGRLVAPFPARVPSSVGYWLVMPNNRKPSPQSLHFQRWILSEIALENATGSHDLLTSYTEV
ncbi:LysR substrate-binding domain-containing protein [Phyllobacterium zundukense]|uniref:LysR substrate-binding domain-containing protein n=1 Tax=Phyllobacterium zundukense TaxID=1867719 RepID=A0ACD4D5F7_9HYPH|nr:LysR substrate-binding domain-containing protein [Phyllobacterium zundukense]UXN61037.1 LysR substrate-binding domain-containing protein [Phyllobacterium zundukense]